MAKRANEIEVFTKTGLTLFFCMFGFKKKPSSLGAMGEQIAQTEYKRLGFSIVGSNVFNRKGKQLGEIDFIAKREKELCFVEVKTRSLLEDKFGGGLEAVNYFKQKKILKAVKLFLISNPEFQKLAPRIDVCLVELVDLDKPAKSVRILSNAVEDD